MKKINVICITLLLIGFISCNGETVNIAIATPTIQCGMCQRNIEMGLASVSGVSASKVDLESKLTTVVYYKDKTDVTKIEKAISDIGYQANDVLANSVTYEGLPACCKIGGMDKI